MSARAKTALITGSSSGIGNDVARAFLERGWNVVLNGRDGHKLEAAAARLGSTSRVALVAGNIGERSTGERMVRSSRERFGGIDVLVNSAGTFAAKPFLEVTEDDLDHYLDGNLKGTYLVSQAVVREMKAQGRGGSIINIGTVLVEHAMSTIPASAPLVSKGGVHALTITLASELAPDGIRVNAVAPGFIRTPLFGDADDTAFAAAALMQRTGSVEDTTAAVLYLAEARFVTGHILRVDGGYATGRR